MKDKKFFILCALAAVWAILFAVLLLGGEANPRLIELVSVILGVWFAWCTISYIWSSVGNKKTPPNDETKNN